MKARKRLHVGSPGKSRRQMYGSEYLKAAANAGFGIAEKGRGRRVWRNRIAVGREGRRIDACKGYLDTRKCTGVTVKMGVLVRKLVMEKGQVTGVEVEKDGKTWVEMAEKEVILCAGPFESPKLLMVSGIGPKDVLMKAGVKVNKDLGVGKGTMGRVFTPFLSTYEGELEPANNRSLVGTKEQISRWQHDGSGVVGTSVFELNGVVGENGYFIAGFVGFSPELENLKVIATFCVSNPNSRGWIRVKSADVEDQLEVKLNLLGSEVEVSRQAECLRQVGKIHDKFRKIFKVKRMTPDDGEEVNEEYVRGNSQFAYHFVGGSAVGRVTNAWLKVRGVRGLRVVDASVIRDMPVSAGPMAETYAIAEYVGTKLGTCYEKRRKGKREGRECFGWIEDW